MRVQNSLVPSLREKFASHRAERARRREIAALLVDPGLSPSARQEITTILIVHENAQTVPIAVPAQRRRATAGSPAIAR
ncbi:hypothetical protein [Frankia sp. AgKG'84/4]|uniref:hypothetical protein n=1 Tax=Frankia sp. AgKG'84/4 TaxID=573490 RepID=UPI00200E1404|nr:hypothetical protein [Frankia sp. AgKG'84/4]MCL9796346.1 hypothetical protein [Frankia sp. AgKG'84/4]